MLQAVLLKYNLSRESITYNSLNELNGKFKTKGRGQPRELYRWGDVVIIGYINGLERQINRYELPPPIDNKLFYADLIIFKMNGDFTKDDFSRWYDKMFGGFENLSSTMIEDDMFWDQDNEYDFSDPFLVRDDDFE